MQQADAQERIEKMYGVADKDEPPSWFMQENEEIRQEFERFQASHENCVARYNAYKRQHQQQQQQQHHHHDDDEDNDGDDSNKNSQASRRNRGKIASSLFFHLPSPSSVCISVSFNVVYLCSSIDCCISSGLPVSQYV